jgi:hypothetical protein
MYNNFRLLTSVSWNTQNRWSTIGFYPDVAESAGLSTADSIYAPAGQIANNNTLNLGLFERLSYILDDAGETYSGVATSPLSNLISKTELAKLYVSHVSNLTTGTADVKSPVVQ